MLVNFVLAVLALIALRPVINLLRLGFRRGVAFSSFDLLSEFGGLTLEAADAVLKDDYRGTVAELLNNTNILAAQLERNTEDFVGRRWVRTMHVGRNHGVGARAEMGTLPTAGNQQYENTYGPVRSMYARIQLSGQTIEAMKNSRGAFIRALDSEMKGATADAERDVNRQYWGTSDGVIATTAANAAGTTHTLSAVRRDWLYHLEEGALIEIRDVSNSNALLSPAGGLSVRSVDWSAGSIVIENPDGTNASNVDTDAGDLICRYGAFGENDNSGNPGDGQIEITGLQTIIDDTEVLHTINPSSEPRWKAQVYGNSGTNRAISENLVTTAIMRGATRAGSTVDLLVGNDGVYRSFANLLTSLKRFTNTVELKGGYSGIEFAVPQMGNRGRTAKTTTVAWDPNAPDNRLYGINFDSLTVAMLLDWDWMDKHGAVLVQVGDTDAYSATLKTYRELVCTNRQANFVIEDITES